MAADDNIFPFRRLGVSGLDTSACVRHKCSFVSICKANFECWDSGTNELLQQSFDGWMFQALYNVTFHVCVCENCRLVALDGRIGEDALVTISKSHSRCLAGACFFFHGFAECFFGQTSFSPAQQEPRFLADTFPISWFRKKDYQLAPSQRAGAGDYMEPASQHLWVQRTLKEVGSTATQRVMCHLVPGFIPAFS